MLKIFCPKRWVESESVAKPGMEMWLKFAKIIKEWDTIKDAYQTLALSRTAINSVLSAQHDKQIAIINNIILHN